MIIYNKDKKRRKRGKMKAVVKSIQIGGGLNVVNLEDACQKYIDMISNSGEQGYRAKIIFLIKLPNGEEKQITIRDEDNETVAYGNFEGLPSFLDYAKEVTKGNK